MQGFPLHAACKGGHIDCIEYLLSSEGGANIDATNKSGVTPLMVAVIAGKLDVAQYLTAKGANTRIRTISAYELEATVYVCFSLKPVCLQLETTP